MNASRIASSSTRLIKQEVPTDGVAPCRINRARITAEYADRLCLVFYPWYCHAIRGHNPFPGLTTDRQKNLGQKNEFPEICTPLSQSTI